MAILDLKCNDFISFKGSLHSKKKFTAATENLVDPTKKNNLERSLSKSLVVITIFLTCRDIIVATK
jgi:hypothetical protein